MDTEQGNDVSHSTPEALPVASGASSSRRPLIGAAIATVFVTTILAALGTWQVQRLAWKTELNVTIAARAHGTARPAPTLAEARALPPDDLDWRPVTIEGRWLPGEALVHTVLGEAHGPAKGPGFWVMAPLERADGSIVWINRGFAPADRRDAAARGEATPSGAVTVTGLMRRSEPRGGFTPADDPTHRLFFVRDPQALSAALGLDGGATAPFTVDASAAATPPGGLPQAGETRLVFENRHLGYAITWYGLAATCVGVFVAWARSKRGPSPYRHRPAGNLRPIGNP